MTEDSAIDPSFSPLANVDVTRVQEMYRVLSNHESSESDRLLEAAANKDDELLGELDPHHHCYSAASMERTVSHRQAQMELYNYSQRRMSRRLIVDLRGLQGPLVDDEESFHGEDFQSPPEIVDDGHVLSSDQTWCNTPLHRQSPKYEAIESSSCVDVDSDLVSLLSDKEDDKWVSMRSTRRRRRCEWLLVGLNQIPAIAVVTMLWLMMALPFGVAYFPIGWSSEYADGNATETDADFSTLAADGIRGQFPLPGKEALGIRMCLFATMIGQLVMTFTSRFTNPIAFQLLENVPFYHALAYTVIRDLGFGQEALSTLVFLFGLSSIIVGIIFYSLGRLELGRLVYFFPSHVLVGCIGGIGIFISMTSISVTNNIDFTLDPKGLRVFLANFHLFAIVIVLESLLRILMWATQDSKGRPKFALLAPVFFCLIVPVFYLGMYLLGVDMQTAKDVGYFFPSPLDASCPVQSDCSPPRFPSNVFDGHVLDMFRIVNIRMIAWTTVFKSLGTVASMACFSLIHVPINIPAFAVSSNVDTDMNIELMAHGYSNVLSGLFGGLQTIMTYSFSVLYMKSGGKGKMSSLIVTSVGGILFVFGPLVSSFIPRCMAGTLLLHVGLDLFLEGIVDSWGSYDYLEYSGILVISFVMTFFGMTAALLAGIITALSTYAVQSITNLDPIFRIMNASTLRSSAWTRSPAANAILDDDVTGRARVLIVQLQGHLFFGNITTLTDCIKYALTAKRGSDDEPFIVIIDFTLVVGMDSSAAHAVAKLKGIMHRMFRVECTIFVSGCHRNSFPCDYALAEALSLEDENSTLDFNDIDTNVPTQTPARARRGSVSITSGSKAMKAVRAIRTIPKNRVCNSLDEALEFAEDVLIARKDTRLFQQEKNRLLHPLERSTTELTPEEEHTLASIYLENLVSTSNMSETEVKRAVATIVSLCRREVFSEHEIIWKQNTESDSMKILVNGKLVAHLEGTDISEVVHQGSTIGELGLVQGGRRLSTVKCVSEKAVTYTLDVAVHNLLIRSHPEVARVIDHIVIRYLSQRVQHVSNRIFETRCMPI